jgi:4-hydroxybenzoate polyprenyltransferase
MIRYKSALVLVLFMSLSALIHGATISSFFSLTSLCMAAALMLVYVCATCINDLADWKIDKVNLKGHADRPLVTGEGNRKELIILAGAAALGAVGIAFFVNFIAVIAVVIGLVFNTLYSLRPIRISHRPILTPFYLAFCYVFVAYLAGYAAAFTGQEFIWSYLIAFYFLFLARISLKDFRDRKGDALAKKPTLILKYGKTVVCILSVTAALIGGTLLLIIVARPYLQLLIGLFLGCLMVVEYRLYKSQKELLELLSVGYGARMGNGIFFALFGTFLLESYGAAMPDVIIFYGCLLAPYMWMFWEYVKHPELFYFGKKKII